MNEQTCLPKKVFKRNDFGLICDDSVVYVYNDDGTINWRKMIKPEFLVPNKKYFQEKGLPIPETVDGLEDKYVLILLGGLKELAQTRGFRSIEHNVTAPSENYVISVCKIIWEPNYETSDREVIFSAIGDAHPRNTVGLGKDFLGPIAENRAFCRAVRNFLKIHIVSTEEAGLSAGESQPEDASTKLLREAMTKYAIPFETIKARLVEESFDKAADMTELKDIPRHKQLELLERIKRKAAERDNPQ
jgi:hypothetical protein